MIEFGNKEGIEAGKAIADAVKMYQKALNDENGKKIAQACIYVEGEAKRNIREYKTREGKLIDTGRMVNSITHVVTEERNGYEGMVGTNVDYAVYQELGTSSIPPRPFLRPALTENRTKVNEIIRNGINQAARRIDKG